jgi:glucose-6-phosphate 1-dehydrogenase
VNGGLSAHAGEAEAGWRIVEPILAAWADCIVPLQDYTAGGDGPHRSSDSDK